MSNDQENISNNSENQSELENKENELDRKLDRMYNPEEGLDFWKSVEKMNLCQSGSSYCPMDSNIGRTGRLIDIVDRSWREEKLPDEHIAVPAVELPDPEPDNGNPQETLREQEQKWADLALNKIHRMNPSNVSQ